MRQSPTGIRTHGLHKPVHRGARLVVNVGINAGSNARLMSNTLPTEPLRRPRQQQNLYVYQVVLKQKLNIEQNMFKYKQKKLFWSI